jgi:hypothetical protein
VYTALGRTAILVCKVRNLGDRAVSWIRQRDLHILTVGETSYTNDLKFFPTHPPGSDEWNLRVRSPGLRDSGSYECQVNTEPKKSRLFHLDVVISKAKIHGDRDLFVQEGSDLNLTCTALSTPEPPDTVVWRHNNLVREVQGLLGSFYAFQLIYIVTGEPFRTWGCQPGEGLL